MKLLKKVLVGIGLFVLAFFAFMTWYKFRYSMDEAITYEVNLPNKPQKVLIATQGSKYKDAIVNGVVEYLKTKDVYILVTDISHLEDIEVNNWNAIVVIHTWEAWQPPEIISSFMSQHYDPKKFIVLTSSGSGEEKMEGIDAITGPSVLEDVPEHVDEINRKLESLL